MLPTHFLMLSALHVGLVFPAPRSLAPRSELPRVAAELERVTPERPRLIGGPVTDDRGVGISGALVTIVGQPQRATTDRGGRFRLEAAPGGEMTLRVAAIGYRPLTRMVSAGEAAEDLRIVLTPARVNLDEVVVTGTAGAEQRRVLGNAMTVIDASEGGPAPAGTCPCWAEPRASWRW